MVYKILYTIFFHIHQVAYSSYIRIAILPTITELKLRRTMNEVMMDGKKYVEHEYASKGVAGTALGLGIGALGLEVLKNGGLQNILNPQPQNQEESAFGLYKGYRDADDAIIAQHNKDAFALYKNQRDGYDVLKAQVDAINTRLAVQEATQPWKEKSIYDAIAMEAERRECADNKIVNYVNTTFAPRYIAELTVGTGTTMSTTFNPLCGC